MISLFPFKAITQMLQNNKKNRTLKALKYFHLLFYFYILGCRVRRKQSHPESGDAKGSSNS